MEIKEFIEALRILSIELTPKQLEQLEQYYQLLVEYNKVMNLTGITEHKEVYLKHFYDSLTLARVCDFSNISTVCDVGTGAGFPGMVLKIVFPHLKVTLVDSLHKRIEFLKVVAAQLELSSLEIVPARAEEYAKIHREEFDMVTARAVAALPILMEYCIPLVKVGGYFIPMKGSNEEQFDHALTKLHCHVEKIDDFVLPIENSKRQLYVICKDQKTSPQYPRKFSEIKRKSL